MQVSLLYYQIIYNVPHSIASLFHEKCLRNSGVGDLQPYMTLLSFAYCMTEAGIGVAIFHLICI